MNFDRSLEAPYGVEIRLSWRVSRLLAPNPGPFTFKGTGVHILGVGARVVVIDPGPELPQHLDALKQALGSRTVSHILVTHPHRDHSPAAAHVKAWSGAKTYGIALARAGDHAANEGMVDEAHDHDFVPDVTVQDGMRISADGFELECVATPGHTANHVCYALGEERALFTGDHVMGWSTSVIAPPDGDMTAYLESLDRLMKRDQDVLYHPAHGEPIERPQRFVRHLMGHRKQREVQILKLLEQDIGLIAEMVQRMYVGVDPRLHSAAALSVLAHLIDLQDRGLARQQDTEWKLAA